LISDPEQFGNAVTEVKTLRNYCEKAGGDLFLHVMRMHAPQLPALSSDADEEARLPQTDAAAG
jgi:hypothetical protein